MDVDRLCYLGHLVQTITSAPRKFIQGARLSIRAAGTVAGHGRRRGLPANIHGVLAPARHAFLRDLAVPMSRLEGRLLVEVDHDALRGLHLRRVDLALGRDGDAELVPKYQRVFAPRRE